MVKEAFIKLEGASLGYTQPVLTGIDLQFNRGDFIGMVGMNGTGKSTLIRTIAGLIPPLAGTITVNGSRVDTTELTELSKQVGLVLTEKIGGFNLTVYDTVAAGRIPYTNAFNRLTENDRGIINSTIELCRLGSFSHKPLNELSDGMFQKTIIAKALAQQTPAILLDEPSAFLDYASKHELFMMMKGLAEKENKCILLSSHDLDLVLKYCHKVCIVANRGARIIEVPEAGNDPLFREIGGGFI